MEFDISRLLRYKLLVLQPVKGWRFSEDSVHLAEFVPMGGRILDAGAGCGVIAMIIKRRFPESKVFALEIDEIMCAVANENFRLNQTDIKIIQADMKNPPLPPIFDVVVSNPPYLPVDEGKGSENPLKFKAKWEIELELESLVKSTANILREKGYFVVCYPVWRMVDVLNMMSIHGIKPVEIKFVHHSLSSPSDFFLVKGRKSVKEKLKVLSPIIRG